MSMHLYEDDVVLSMRLRVNMKSAYHSRERGMQSIVQAIGSRWSEKFKAAQFLGIPFEWACAIYSVDVRVCNRVISKLHQMVAIGYSLVHTQCIAYTLENCAKSADRLVPYCAMFNLSGIMFLTRFHATFQVLKQQTFIFFNNTVMVSHFYRHVSLNAHNFFYNHSSSLFQPLKWSFSLKAVFNCSG